MDIKNQYEFFKNVKLTEDGYLIVSGAGGGTPEEVNITINGDVYKSVEAPNTENIIVKDEDGNTVGSLIGGEWIVPSGSSGPIATTTYFPLTNTVTNPVYNNTGNYNQTVNGQSYNFVPNAGLYFVSPPTNFRDMFRGKPVNDPDIGLWDVSNITSMLNMFINGYFNQDIGNWDVSNVTSMSNMFMNNTNFNQDLSGWCVTNIPTEPSNFSVGSALIPANKPVWGTCP